MGLVLHFAASESRYSAVGIAAGYGLDNRVVRVFTSLQPNLPCNGYREVLKQVVELPELKAKYSHSVKVKKT
jgi:hypothetical protein